MKGDDCAPPGCKPTFSLGFGVKLAAETDREKAEKKWAKKNPVRLTGEIGVGFTMGFPSHHDDPISYVFSPNIAISGGWARKGEAEASDSTKEKKEDEKKDEKKKKKGSIKDKLMKVAKALNPGPKTKNKTATNASSILEVNSKLAKHSGRGKPGDYLGVGGTIDLCLNADTPGSGPGFSATIGVDFGILKGISLGFGYCPSKTGVIKISSICFTVVDFTIKFSKDGLGDVMKYWKKFAQFFKDNKSWRGINKGCWIEVARISFTRNFFQLRFQSR